MHSRNYLDHLETLYSNYDAFIFDLWGVIHDGYNLYPGVLNFLRILTRLNKTIIFVSNAPRPAPILMQKLTSFGINLTSDMMLTSGDLVRAQLETFSDPVFKKLGNHFYHLGANRNEDILAGLSVNVVNDLNNADFVLLTAFMDIGENLNQYDDFLKSIVFLKLPVICANPDKEIINGDKIRYCAGVLAEKIENMGGIVHYYGKPYLTIFNEAIKRLNTKNIHDKNRIVMLGDTLETDILGATNAGISTALLLTGNMRLLTARHGQDSIPSNEWLSDLFKRYEVNPSWVIPHFDLPC